MSSSSKYQIISSEETTRKSFSSIMTKFSASWDLLGREVCSADSPTSTNATGLQVKVTSNMELLLIPWA